MYVCMHPLSKSQECFGTVTWVSLNKCVLSQAENLSWTVKDATDHSYVQWQIIPERRIHREKGIFVL